MQENPADQYLKLKLGFHILPSLFSTKSSLTVFRTHHILVHKDQLQPNFFFFNRNREIPNLYFSVGRERKCILDFTPWYQHLALCHILKLSAILPNPQDFNDTIYMYRYHKGNMKLNKNFILFKKQHGYSLQ